jgi:hypothetical protein
VTSDGNVADGQMRTPEKRQVFGVSKVRTQWITSAVPGHLVIDSENGVLTFRPRWFFAVMCRRKAILFPLCSVKVSGDQWIQNVGPIIGRLPPTPALRVRTDDGGDFTFVPAGRRFDKLMTTVEEAVARARHSA